MGYYSEVGFEIRKDDFERFLKEIKTEEFLSKYELDSEKRILDVLKMANISKCKENDSIIVHFPDIKWYSAETTAVQDFVQSLSEFSFLRVGEDYDDVASYWCSEDYCFDALSLHRQIVTEYEVEEVNIDDMLKK